ncbi:MAG TPA: ESX secretion-associated protein EspG [Pseudonocardiaceae bacterium]|nr:ESX secretion-associated protein EspG [Pseudonocardiaceae bacterium]
MLIELGCADLCVAWQHAELGPPPPLFTVRGQDEEPDGATVRLTALGLITPLGHVHPDLCQAMTAFAQSPVEVDLRFTAGRARIRAAVATLDDAAHLAVVTGGHVRFSRVPAEAAVAALVGVLPAERPAGGTPVCLPVADVDLAVTRSMEAPHRADEVFVDALVERGVDLADARLFTTLVGSRRVRLAEFGITFLDRARVRQRCAASVQVVDTRYGRAVLCATHDYVLAAPADEVTVVRELTRLRDAELDRLRGNRLG